MTDLFSPTPFRSHSGLDLSWKIDCDALSDVDLVTLAKVVAERMTFCKVVGVPRGGLRFATVLSCYCSGPDGGTLLIVADVLTTGGSMQRERKLHSSFGAFKEIVGVVIFARGPCPDWVQPIFTLASWM